ncbi:MAG: hypothetical protein AAF915_12620 [Cyanobacteria bacterium P01_D01_bin.50]
MEEILENGNQLSESIVLGNGERVVIDKEIIAPVGDPAVEIPGNDARLVVENTGSILAPDAGNTAVQVSGTGDIIRNSGEISGNLNGVSSTGERLNLINQGTITSDSRAVYFIAGDGSSLENSGNILGTGNQRNGTVYINGPVDNARINNSSDAVIDAGVGNTGDGISVQVGVDSEDAISDGIIINNSGIVAGRGQPGFEAGNRTTGNGSSGVRYFNGTSAPEAILRGSLNNSGTISSEANVGFLGGVVVEDGVSFQGAIENRRGGLITGVRNGLYIGNADHNLTIENQRGARIESGSRAVNLDGDNITLNNSGEIFGIGDQRNGTVYIDGTGDNITVNNRSNGVIDAGEGNGGSGYSVQVGASSEDALSENINLFNEGVIQGRGNTNVPAGVRFFNGSGEDVATVTGDITNTGNAVIASETAAGILIESGVAFNGTITNDGIIRGGNDLAIDATGSQGEIKVINNGILEGAVKLGEGNDSFLSNSSVGVLVDGGGGNDTITGGSGDDTLVGGAGNDILTGNGGSDTFVFSTGSDVDIIQNFEVSNDLLDVAGLFGDIDQILGAGGAASQNGNDTLIDFGNNDLVTLVNVNVDTLSENNFVFG